MCYESITNQWDLLFDILSPWYSSLTTYVVLGGKILVPTLYTYNKIANSNTYAKLSYKSILNKGPQAEEHVGIQLPSSTSLFHGPLPQGPGEGIGPQLEIGRAHV